MPGSLPAGGAGPADFNKGHAAGLAADQDLTIAELRDPRPRLRVTGLRSRWLHRRCQVCGHSFRLGDEVMAYPDGRGVHDMPGLRCTAGGAL